MARAWREISTGQGAPGRGSGRGWRPESVLDGVVGWTRDRAEGLSGTGRPAPLPGPGCGALPGGITYEPFFDDISPGEEDWLEAALNVGAN